MNALDLATLELEEMNTTQLQNVDGGWLPFAIAAGLLAIAAFSSCGTHGELVVRVKWDDKHANDSIR